MNYQECLAYLDRLGNEVLGMKLGLDTIRGLLEALGSPHRSYPAVVISGTNAKGSVARFLASLCGAAGIRTGLFTSPHLVRVEERIRVGGLEIPPQDFAATLSQVVEAARQTSLARPPTYFETLTATAFLYFQQRKVDLAVLEVGMGGRLDSTNVADRLLSVVTPVGYDHLQYLGKSLRQIAGEKAGIFQPGRPALSAPQRPVVRQVLEQRAGELGCPLTLLSPEAISLLDSRDGRYRFHFRDMEFDLQVYGEFQAGNAALAVEAFLMLEPFTGKVSSTIVQEAIRCTRTPGSLQRLTDSPCVFVDGAHNPDAAEKLSAFVLRHTPPPRTLVFGIMKDKQWKRVLRLLEPCFERIYLTRVASRRAAEPKLLQRFCRRGVPVVPPMEAYRRALGEASTVVVAGSLYLAGEVLREFSPKPENA